MKIDYNLFILILTNENLDIWSKHDFEIEMKLYIDICSLQKFVNFNKFYDSGRWIRLMMKKKMNLYVKDGNFF